MSRAARSALAAAFWFAAIPAAATEPWRFRVEPWAGTLASNFRGLSSFADAAVDARVEEWASKGETLVSRERAEPGWAYTEGIDFVYCVDPMVRVSARVARTESMAGSVVAVTEKPDSSHRDTWTYRTKTLMLMGGTGFTVWSKDRLEAVITLHLGTMLADVEIEHRQAWIQTGMESLVAGHASGRGSGFIPEFGADLEYEHAPGVVLGLRTAWRFGGVGSFTHRHESAVNSLRGTPESLAGIPIRDANREYLAVDYGGPVLAVSLACRI